MVGSSPSLKLCAAYTRRFSEEGLEQDINSPDAQREAHLAYIQSQKGERWRSIRTTYGDGGYSAEISTARLSPGS